ncbi:MAG: methyltransferase domain-containing protein, partial [Actinobacteria bacterium]|nr:methyltransferase domain-containing protein [Actinomycetota bacterium]
MDDAALDAFAAWERSSWETRAAAYAADVGVLTRGAIAALLGAAGVSEGSRVLDVATGPGFVGQAALDRGAVVIAVDQSEAMVEIARRVLPDVRQASAEDLGLPDASFDAVVGGFLLNHLARPEVGVAELVRVLAPGGRLALTVWDRPDANRAMGLLGEVVTSLGITGVVPPGPDSTLFADEALFADLLGGAGLADVVVARTTWPVDVEPGAWFDTVAAAMPRSGAVLAAAEDEQRLQARAVYVERALEAY